MTMFKKFGLTIIFTYALCMIGAGSASAQHFLLESYALMGEQTETNVFTTLGGAGKTECTGVTYSGVLGEETTATELPLTPKYENCTSLGESATIDVNSCSYRFTIPNEAGKDNPVELQCSKAEDKIVVTTAGCEITTFAQTPTGGGVSYEAGGTEPNDLVAKLTVTGVHYKLHKTCLLLTGQPTEHTFTDGTLSGKITVRAFFGGAPIGITAK
jgi:hypothetical protein